MRNKDNILLENAYDEILSKGMKKMESDSDLIPDNEYGIKLSHLNKKLKKIEEKENPIYIKPTDSSYRKEFGSLKHLQPVGSYKLILNKENTKNYGLYHFDLIYVGDEETPEGLWNPNKPLEFIASKSFHNLTARSFENILLDKDKKVWIMYPDEIFSEGLIMFHNDSYKN